MTEALQIAGVAITCWFAGYAWGSLSRFLRRILNKAST